MKSRACFILLLCVLFVGSASAIIFKPGVGSADPNDIASHDQRWDNPDNWGLTFNPASATHAVPSGSDKIWISCNDPGAAWERAIVDSAAPVVTGIFQMHNFARLDVVDGGSLTIGHWSQLSQTAPRFGQSIINLSGDGSLVVDGIASAGHSLESNLTVNMKDTSTFTTTNRFQAGRNQIDGGGHVTLNICEDAVFKTTFFWIECSGWDKVKVNLSGNAKMIITGEGQYTTAKTVDNILEMVDGEVFGDPNNILVELVPEVPFTGANDIEITLVDPNTPYCGEGLGLQGDLTGNCVVDIDDVLVMAANWTGDELDDVTLCPDLVGDINGDCIVDIYDYALLAARWQECAWSDQNLCPVQ